jgi:hypothetical protein
MKPILFLSLVLASLAWADEATDRDSIATTVARLSGSYPQPLLFTSDFDGSSDFERMTRFGQVIISKEPFGEAEVRFPSATGIRFVIRSIRFLTGDVALVDAFDRQNGLEPVLLVIRKEGVDWRLASFRRIVDKEKPAP